MATTRKWKIKNILRKKEEKVMGAEGRRKKDVHQDHGILTYKYGADK